MNYLLLILPILISVLTYFQTIKKDNSGLVSELAKELVLKEPTPYVVECLVSKIHSIIPLSFEHLRVLLKSNNAYSALVYFAKCRRDLCFAELVFNGEQVNFDFTPHFKKKTSRIISMLLCLGVIILMYYEFIQMFNMAIDFYMKIKFISPVNELLRSELHFKFISYTLAFVTALIICFLFAWLLINIYQAKNMINRANTAIKNGFYIK